MCPITRRRHSLHLFTVCHDSPPNSPPNSSPSPASPHDVTSPPASPRYQRAYDDMDVSQSRFTGPPTPVETQETEEGFIPVAMLPDLFVKFIAPEPKVNPYYEDVKKESEQWMKEHLWKDLSKREVKKRCAADFCYFGAIMCPDVSKEELRTVCDWIYWVFEFDDQFDEGELGMDSQRATAEIQGMVSILSGQEEYETSMQRLFRDIWRKVGKTSSDGVKERYKRANARFCHSVAELHGEEFDDKVVMHNIRRYLQVRAENIGLYPLLALVEYAYGLDLPDEVSKNEAIQEVQRLVAEMLTLQNDILSYHREHSVGHSQNLITIFRRNIGLSQQESYDKANELLHRCYRQWYIAHSQIPSWGEKTDVQVQQYLKACVDVLKANVRWSFKSHRYFGNEVDRVRETRQVALIP